MSPGSYVVVAKGRRLEGRVGWFGAESGRAEAEVYFGRVGPGEYMLVRRSYLRPATPDEVKAHEAAGHGLRPWQRGQGVLFADVRLDGPRRAS